MLNKSFRDVYFSFSSGLSKALSFCFLILGIFFTYSLAAFCLFADPKNPDMDANSDYNFDDFVMSLYVMYSMFLGTWSAIIIPAALRKAAIATLATTVLDQ